MICPNCRYPNDQPTAFCARCRAPLTPPMPGASVAPQVYAPPSPMCRVCGVLLGARSTCPHCGAPIGTTVNPNDPTFATYLPFGATYPVSNRPGEEEMPSRPARRPWQIALMILGALALLLATLLSGVFLATRS